MQDIADSCNSEAHSTWDTKLCWQLLLAKSRTKRLEGWILPVHVHIMQYMQIMQIMQFIFKMSWKSHWWRQTSAVVPSCWWRLQLRLLSSLSCVFDVGLRLWRCSACTRCKYFAGRAWNAIVSDAACIQIMPNMQNMQTISNMQTEHTNRPPGL